MLKTLVFLSLIFCFYTYSNTWVTENQWTQEYEQKYQTWVNEGFHKNIFTDSKSYLCNLNTDCADMVYFARAIFSFENNLPFQVKNTLGGPETYIHNESNLQYSKKEKFLECLSPEAKQKVQDMNKSLDDVLRFKSFLAFLGRNVVSTKTLAFNDTFPVAPKDISPGDIYVSPTETDRHSFLIQNIHPQFYLTLIFDTMTEEVTPLNVLKTLPQYVPTQKDWGIKRFKQPKEFEKVIQENRGFSERQYDFLSSSNYFREIFKLKFGEKLEKEPIKEEIFRRMKNICTLLKSRQYIVQQTLQAKKKTQYLDAKKCFKKSIYRKFSTPSRDATIMKEISSLYEAWDKRSQEELATLPKSYQALVPTLKKYDSIQKVKSKDLSLRQETLTIKQIQKNCSVDLKTKKYTILDYINAYSVKSLSSNPNDNFEARWGLDNHKIKIVRTQCPHYSN